MRRLKLPALLLLCLLAIACPHDKRDTADKVPPPPATPALPPAQKPDIILSQAQAPFQFVAYGDIRFTKPRPTGDDRLSNPFARGAIVKAIADAHPALVLISGDLVLRGANAEDWRVFDAETKPLADAHVPILPTVGNHEYGSESSRAWGRSQGLRNYFRHFPNIPNRPATPWYSVQYGNCYFLMLDSEDDDSQSSEQMNWVRSQLLSLPPTIDYVFLVLHRPPYSNISDKGHRPRPSEIEFARMLESRQQVAPRPQLIVIAGHVHNYERFEKNRVIYLVSGGGGAEPVAIRNRHDDLYHPADGDENEFHYCLFTVDGDRLKFEMLRLASDRPTARFEVRDSFELPRPAK